MNKMIRVFVALAALVVLPVYAGTIDPQARNLAANPRAIPTGGSVASSLSNLAARDLSPFDFNAKCDGLEYLNTGSTTATSPTVNTGSAVVPASAIGKTIVLIGAGSGGATLATTIISANGGSTIQVAIAPSTTLATIADWFYGTLDGTALQNWINYAASNGISHIQIPGGVLGSSQPTRCLTEVQLELSTNGNPYNNNVIIEGSGFDGAAIYAAASMANVVHRGTTTGVGGGLRDIVIDGNGLVTNAVVQVIGSRGFMFDNSQFRDATGSAYNLEIGDGSTSTPDWHINHVKAWTNTAYFSAAQMPAKDVYITAAATDGGSVSLIAANARTNNVHNDGAGNYFFHTHPFNTTYPTIAPVDGIEVSAQAVFVATEVDNAIGSNSGIHVNATGSIIKDTYIGCNAGAATGLYGIDIASGKGRIVVEGTTYETACTLTTANSVHQSGSAASSTLVCGNANSTYTEGCQTSFVVTPGGRLTLTTNTPVLNADVTSATTVYYDSFLTDQAPIYSGSNWQILQIASNQISMGLDTTNFASGNLYDVYGVNNSGALAICIGPAWSSGTARGTGAGTTELVRINGIWVNKNTLTHCYGGVSGVTDYGSLAAQTATYLGTLDATSNGTTKCVINPSATAGGGNPYCGLSNAYNRVRAVASSNDNGTSWHCTACSSTWEVADVGGTGSGLNNRFTWVDGLQQTAIQGYVKESLTNAGSGNPVIGVVLDSTSSAPLGANQLAQNAAGAVSVSAQMAQPPLLGRHFIQGMQQAINSTPTFNSGFVVQATWDY